MYEPNLQIITVFAYLIIWRDHRFSPSTDVAGHTPVKQSVQRQIRAAVLSQWKIEPETLEAIWPKKESLVHVKWSAQLVSCMQSCQISNLCLCRVAESIYQCTPSIRNQYFSNTLTVHFTQHYDYCINVIQWASFRQAIHNSNSCLVSVFLSCCRFRSVHPSQSPS